MYHSSPSKLIQIPDGPKYLWHTNSNQTPSKDIDVNRLTNKFMKRLNGIIHKCFKKIRIQEGNDNDKINELFERKLKSKLDNKSKKILEFVEDELAEKMG